MKEALIFLFLIVLVVCPYPSYDREERIQKRKEFQNQLKECILKNDNISNDLKNQLQENKDDDLRKVLFTQFSKLEQSDREIIRKCRKEYYEKVRFMNRERFQGRFNHSYPFLHHHFPFLHRNRTFNDSHHVSENDVTSHTSAHPSKSGPPCNSSHSSAHAHPSASAHPSKSSPPCNSTHSSAKVHSSASGHPSKSSSAHAHTSTSGHPSKSSSAHAHTSASGHPSKSSSAHAHTSASGHPSKSSSAHAHTSASGHPAKSSPPCNSTHSSAKVHPSSSAN